MKLDEDESAALGVFKQSGGIITLVQEPKSAERPQMPLAAIDTRTIDYVLAPNAIAGQFEKLVQDFSRPQ